MGEVIIILILNRKYLFFLFRRALAVRTIIILRIDISRQIVRCVCCHVVMFVNKPKYYFAKIVFKNSNTVIRMLEMHTC